MVRYDLLHKYMLAAMGCCFAIRALVVDLPSVKGYLLNNGVCVQAENDGVYPENLDNLLKGLFCAGAVIIPSDAVLCQPLVPAVVKTSAALANVRLAAVKVGERSVGNGIVIHSFGCLGDAAVWVQQTYDRAMRSSRADDN